MFLISPINVKLASEQTGKVVCTQLANVQFQQHRKAVSQAPKSLDIGTSKPKQPPSSTCPQFPSYAAFKRQEGSMQHSQGHLLLKQTSRRVKDKLTVLHAHFGSTHKLIVLDYGKEETSTQGRKATFSVLFLEASTQKS